MQMPDQLLIEAEKVTYSNRRSLEDKAGLGAELVDHGHGGGGSAGRRG